MFQGSDRGVATPNARDQHTQTFASGEKWEGYYARNLIIERSPRRCDPGLDPGYALRLDCLQPNCTQGLALQGASPRGVSAHPGKAHGLVRRRRKLFDLRGFQGAANRGENGGRSAFVGTLPRAFLKNVDKNIAHWSGTSESGQHGAHAVRILLAFAPQTSLVLKLQSQGQFRRTRLQQRAGQMRL